MPLAHQILEILAYLAGFQLYLHLRRRWPQPVTMSIEQTAWVVIGAIFGALIGSKLLAWAESFPEYWAHRTDWRILIGGKTIVGAILGGWIGVELAKRRLGIGHPSGDVYVFPLILGMIIGRIGCFFGGLADQTYGLPTSLPWGIDFGDGIPRHPAQLYEIAFLLTIGAVLAWRLRAGRQSGCMFSQFVLAYLAFRFAVEFIKPRHTLPLAPLSAIQLASLGGMVYALRHWSDQCCGSAALARDARASGPAARADGFVELTTSLCPSCLKKIEAKLIIESGQVFQQKFCPDHGSQRVLIADDAAYWQQARALNKPPTPPPHRHTGQRRGCPHDCGLCPDHEQHTCLAIVEITDQCDLACPVCYARSGGAGRHRTLGQIERMLDAVVAAENPVPVVQISGGEPTLHPDLFAILDAARKRPIRHLMLNTNGRRIAEDPAFVQRLASYRPGFEVYLQFDSPNSATLQALRGRDLSSLRRRALEALNKHNISTTLVATLKKGLNDREIGWIIDYALGQPCVRGVTFQPIQFAGRLNGFDAAKDRLTLTEVRRAIFRQHSLFTERDIVPVPCHPDCLASAYAIRANGKAMALSKLVDPGVLTELGGNTICYEQDPDLRQRVRQLATGPAARCCQPIFRKLGGDIRYENVFRVVIMQFMDAWSMDLRALKRSCVHIVHPDGRLVPFETYNLFHRQGVIA